MPVLHNPYGESGKEIRKWEQHDTQYSINEDGISEPGNRYAYRPYPRMLYRAIQRMGKHLCCPPPPDPMGFATDKEYERACLDMEQIGRQSTRVVQSEDEERRAKNEGWRDSPDAALAALKAEEDAIATAAAEAAYAAQRLTEKARAEFDQAQVGTARHVTDVAGGSKKPGRPKKVKPVAPEVREQVQA